MCSPAERSNFGITHVANPEVRLPDRKPHFVSRQWPLECSHQFRPYQVARRLGQESSGRTE
jgi:hypothetical protein